MELIPLLIKRNQEQHTLKLFRIVSFLNMSIIFDPNQGGFEENSRSYLTKIQRRVGQKLLSYLIIT